MHQIERLARVVCLASILLFPAAAFSTDLDTLAAWMTGSFSSEEQAAADESYFDIRLEMVRIWKERKDGYWLYVEQAAATNLDQPYRQRVYHLTAAEDGSLVSEVFAIPDSLEHAGEFRMPEPLAGLSPESLEVREGCAVILRKGGDKQFSGATVEHQCKSGLRGASYATSEVTVGPDSILSWDRGFAESGEQVWGAEKGPYLFLRWK
jgi:hypothetical protein